VPTAAFFQDRKRPSPAFWTGASSAMVTLPAF
jgi:hypothetical protein